MAAPKDDRTPLNLALQGGGAHGAFTWGVLDALLESGQLAFDTISGTSAGAVNAVAFASGYATGGAEGARACLNDIWKNVSDQAVGDLSSLNPFMAGWRGLEAWTTESLARFSGALSPYEFNPLDINPLRAVLDRHVDFDAVRRGAIHVTVAATDVETGSARVFETSEINLDVVLASACLPALTRAVEIEGRYYWDGGFSANPDLLSIARLSQVRDTLLILISPLTREGFPRSPQEIAGEVARVTFNQPLLRDIELIDAVRRSRGFSLKPASEFKRLAKQRFHLIDAGRHTAELGPETKLSPDRAIVEELFTAGRKEAHLWLENKATDLGRRETADLAAHLRKAKLPPDDHAKTA